MSPYHLSFHKTMAHSSTNNIFIGENLASYRRKLSSSVQKASALVEERKHLTFLSLAGQQSLRSLSSWLKSHTTNLLDLMVGVKNGDDAFDRENIYITRDLQRECEAEFHGAKSSSPFY